MYEQHCRNQRFYRQVEAQLEQRHHLRVRFFDSENGARIALGITYAGRNVTWSSASSTLLLLAKAKVCCLLTTCTALLVSLATLVLTSPLLLVLWASPAIFNDSERCPGRQFPATRVDFHACSSSGCTFRWPFFKLSRSRLLTCNVLPCFAPKAATTFVMSALLYTVGGGVYGSPM